MRCQLDHPVGQLADPVVVGGDDHDPAGAGQVSQEAQDPFDLDVIEVGRWFVRQDQRRIVHERAGDRHPLLLPSGHLRRTVMSALAEPDELQKLTRPRLRLGARDSREPHWHNHIAVRGQAGDEIEGLKDDPDGLPPIVGQSSSPQVGDRRRTEFDSPRCRGKQASEAREQCRLAATRRSEQDDQLAVKCRKA